MNKRIVRIIALVLCAVMVLGMIPLLVHAEEIQPRSITQEDNTYLFDSFEDLKELAAGTYSERTYFEHQGSEDLVISEDLTMPENAHLISTYSKLCIPEGVTLRGNYVSAKYMVVEGWLAADQINSSKEILVGLEGTLTASTSIDTFEMTVEGYVETMTLTASNSLEITGSVCAYQEVETWNLQGAENITSDCDIILSRLMLEFGELEEMITIANQFLSDSRVSCTARIRSEPIEFTGYTEFPANCTVNFESYVTIAADAKLVFRGTMTMNMPLTIQGELEVADLALYANRESGSLTVEEGGTFSFQKLRINAASQDVIPGLLNGMDMDQYTIIKKSGNFTNWEVIPVNDQENPAQPADYAWGYEAVSSWDETTGALVTGMREGTPSSFCWKQKGGTTVKYELCVIMLNVYYSLMEGTYEAPDVEYIYHSVDMSREYNLINGTYYVRLTTLDDNTDTDDSESIISEPWEYIRAGTKFEVCTDLVWQEQTRTPSWTEVADSEYLEQYELEYYYSPADLYIQPQRCTSAFNAADAVAVLNNAISQYGEGDYYFKVRAISSDIAQVYHGEWSELSPPLHVDGVIIIPGDMNGDSMVDDSDVAQLLWHTLFPDSYAVSGNADLNGDYLVDDADVSLLLWHILFPDTYPIN